MNDIVRQIERGKCVPFLGAAANARRSQPLYEGLPLGAQLATKIFQELGHEETKQKNLQSLANGLNFDSEKITALLVERGCNQETLDQLTDIEKVEKLFAEFGLSHQRENDLSRLSLELDAQIGRPGLNRFLKNEIPDEEREPSPLLKTLAKLPLKLIITTNYDRLMEKALKDEGKKEGKDFKIIIQNVGGFTTNITEEIASFWANKGLILYKIHGTFSEKLPGLGIADNDQVHDAISEKIIITEDDYIEFLSIIGDKHRGIPTLISSKLVNATLLFFGYSLEDWDFRVVYKSLIEGLDRSQQEKAYAFQKNPPEFWVNLWKDKGIDIFDIDLYDFAEELDK